MDPTNDTNGTKVQDSLFDEGQLNAVSNTGSLTQSAASLEGDNYASMATEEAAMKQRFEAASGLKTRSRTLKFATLGTILAIGVVLVVFRQLSTTKTSGGTAADASGRYHNISIPLADLATNSPSLSVNDAQTLSINGQLNVNNSLVLAPAAQPSTAVAGQLYFDQTSKELAYYNGSAFVPLNQNTPTPLGVSSLGSATGAVALGGGLAVNSGTLSNTGVLTLQGQAGNITLAGGPGIVVNGTTLSNSGLLSLGGQNGDITLGAGLGLTGSQLRNTGIISAVGAGSITVTNDGSGNITIDGPNGSGGGSGTVASPGGTSGKIAKFTGIQTIADSLISDDGTTVTVGGNLSVTGTVSLTTPLAVTSGGTGANNAASARANLGAAKSGANSDITSLSGLTTALTVAQGGIGVGTLATNGVVVGNGTSPLSAVVAGSAGQCLVSTAGAPTWSPCPGASGVSSLNGGNGALTLNNASLAGSNITINDATTAAKGIASFNSTNFSVASGAVNTIQNINTTASPTFGQLTLTSSQATNPMFVVNNTNAAASGALLDLQLNGASKFSVSPAGNITSTGTLNGQTISAAANFTGSVAIGTTLTVNTVTPTSSLTVGSTGQSFLLQGNAGSTFTATNGASTTTLAFQTPTANVTYNFPTAAAGTYNICTTVGNCAGVGGGVITPGGTANTIAKFTAGGVIGNSSITDNGTTVTVGGTLSVNTITSSSALTIGTTGQNMTLQGATVNLTSTAAGITNSLTFATPSGSNKTITIPNATGTLAVSASGPLALDSAGNLTIGNAKADGSTKGAAAFNGTNFTDNGSGIINTVQNINTTASPTFGQLTVTSSQAANAMMVINNTNVATTGNLIDLQLNGTSKFSVAPSGNTTIAGTLAVNTITPSSALTVGATAQSFTIQGSASSTITATGGGQVTTVGFTGTPTGAVTYNFDRAATAGTYTICTTVGNCAGVGGGVTTPGGTANTIAKFTAGGTIGNSSITDNGTTVTVGATLVVNTITPTSALTVGATGQNMTLQGATVNLTATSGGITNSLTFATPSGSNKTVTIPNASGTVAVSASGPIVLDAAGNLTCPTCLTSGGGGGTTGVTSVNSLTGALSVANATGSGSTITINNAKADGSTKGIATFNGTNFQDNGSGVINTIQDIATAAAPTFGQLTITSSQAANAMMVINNTNVSAAGNLIDLKLNGSSKFSVAPSGNTTIAGTLSVNTLTPTTALTLGATGQGFTLQGSGSSIITSTANGHTTVVGFTGGSPTTDPTYKFDSSAPTGTYNVCTTAAVCTGYAASAGSGNYIQNQASTPQGASFFIQSVNVGDVTGVLRMKSGQTADIFQVQAVSGNPIFQIAATSNLATFNDNVRIVAPDSTPAALVVRSSGGASDLILDLHNPSDNTVARVDANGNLYLGNMAQNIPGSLFIAQGANGYSVIDAAGTTSGTHTLHTPSEDGTICVRNSTNCGFVRLAPSSVQSDASTNPSIFINDTGGGNLLQLQSNMTDQLILTNGGALQAASIDTITVGGTLAVGGANASTINIATNGAAHTINIGIGAAAQTITIGSGNGSSSVALQGGTGGLTFAVQGTVTEVIDQTGNFYIRPLNNSGSILRVVNSTATTDLLIVDGATGTTMAHDFQVNSGGMVNIVNGTLRIAGGGTTAFHTPGTNGDGSNGVDIPTKINIPIFDPGAFGQVIAVGLPSTNCTGAVTSSCSARAITVLDARTLSHQPSIAVLSPNENERFGFTWNGSNSLPLLYTSVGQLGFGVGGGTPVYIDSTNASLTQLVVGISGPAGKDGSLTFSNASNSNQVSLLTGTTSSSYIIKLPAAIGSAGNCLNIASVASGTATLGYTTCGGGGNAFLQGGNAFGATGVLGTTDNNALSIITNNVTRATFAADGSSLTLGSNMNLTLQGSSAHISNTQGQTNSEAFGAGATVSGSGATAVGNIASAVGGATALGYKAVASGNGNSIAIGNDAQASDWGVAVGSGIRTTGNWTVAIGFGASTTGQSSVAIGNGASAAQDSVAINGTATGQRAVVLGSGATSSSNDTIVLGAGATSTTGGQFVAGSNTSVIAQAVFGNGVTNTAPIGFTLQATSTTTGTSNVAGGSITIAGGQGTGTGAGGNINFQIAKSGTTGSSQNALSTVASLSGTNGSALFKNAADSTTAFQVQNAAGSATILNVDTTNSRVTTNGGLYITDPTNPQQYSFRVDPTTGLLKLTSNAVGYTESGDTGADGGNINMISASKYNSGTGGTVSSVYFFSPNANGTTDKIEIAIYADNGSGSPSGQARLGATNLSGTVLNAGPAWTKIPLTSSVTLSPNTNYWFAFNVNGGFGYGTHTGSAGDAEYTGALTFGASGLPATFPTTGLSSGFLSYSVYSPYDTVNDQTKSAAAFTVDDNNSVVFRPRYNQDDSGGTGATFQVQNAGGTDLLSVNTASGYVGVNGLQVGGVDTSYNMYVSGNNSSGTAGIYHNTSTTTDTILNLLSDVGGGKVSQLAVKNNGDLTFGNTGNHTLSVTQAGSGTGKSLTVVAGQGASGQVGGNLVLQGGANGTASGTTGSVIVKANGGNSTTAFQVQNAAGAGTFTIDTTNGRVGVNTAAPSERLSVNGNLSVRDADAATKQFRLRTSGSSIDLETGGTSLVVSTWSNADFTGTQYPQLTFNNAGNPIKSDQSLDFEGSADRTIKVQQLAIAGAGKKLIIQAGQGNGANNGGDLLLQGGARGSSGNTGSVTVKANGTDSLTTFQVQNAAGAGTFTVDTTNNGTIIFGASAGSGTVVVNNGATVNTVYAMANLATGGWDAGGAAATVDKYTSISANQTTAGQILTIPTPTANTTYGRVLYLSNIGTASFTIGGFPLKNGATATFVWSNTNGGASWQYAGVDGAAILNQNSSTQTADFKINGTGQAANFDAVSGALGIGNSVATGVNIGNTTNTTALLLQGAAGATYTVGTSNNTGGITLGNSTASNTINIGNATVATGNTEAINIGTASTGTGVVNVTIGSTNAASNTTIQGGSGNINLTATGGVILASSDISFNSAAHNINFNANGATNGSSLSITGQTGGAGNGGAINVTGGTATGGGGVGGLVTIKGGNSSSGGVNGGVTIDTGTGATSSNGSVLIGNTNANTVTIGNTSANTVVNIQGGASGTGAINIGAASGFLQTVSIGNNTNANTGVSIEAGSSNSIAIGNASNTSHSVFIGTNSDGTHTQSIVLGNNTNVASTTDIRGGNGASAITLTPQTTGSIVIGASAGTGQITLGSSSAAQTVAIANGFGVSTVNIANSSTGSNSINIGNAIIAAGNTEAVNIGTNATSTGKVNITIGSTNDASTTTLQAGTGNINLVTNQANAGTIVKTATTNSTTAFQIQNSGSVALLTADTVNQRISIGSGGTAVGQLYLPGTVPSGTLSSISTTEQGSNIVTQGRYAYVLTSSKLRIFDVSRPNAMTSLGSVSVSSNGDLQVQGKYAYVTNRAGSGNVYVIDISNPSSPSIVSTTALGGTLQDTYFQGRYLFALTLSGVSAYDMANPANPVFVSSFSLGSVTAQYLTGQGKYVYITSDTKFFVIDVSNPASMSQAGVLTTTQTYELTAQGRYVYIGSNGGAEIRAIDVSNPASPTSVGTVTTNMNFPVANQRYLYTGLGFGSNSWRIIDISNPASMSIVGTVSTPGGVYGTAQLGRYLFALDWGSSTLLSYDLGGEYAQSLEAGNIETGNITINDQLIATGNASFQGSTSFGQSVSIGGDLGVSGNILFQNKTNSSTSFQIQNSSGTALFIADTTSSMSITLGNSGNTVTFTTSGGLVAAGNARHAKTLLLTPEYAGGVLDALNDASCSGAFNGTMTSGYDSTNRMNYYDWTTAQGSAQCYDVIVQVPIPSDFSAWSGNPDVEMQKDSTGTAAYAIQITPSSGSDANYGSFAVHNALTTSWSNMANNPLSGTYTAGDYLTIKIRMTSTSGANVKLGNIKLQYLSGF